MDDRAKFKLMLEALGRINLLVAPIYIAKIGFVVDTEQSFPERNSPDYSAKIDIQNRNTSSLPCNKKSKERIVKNFCKEEFAKSIIEFLETDLKAGADKTTNDALIDFLDSEWPEINSIAALRKQFHAKVRKPRVSFKESGQRLDEYIETKFKKNVDAGYLPVSGINDGYLRGRIKNEKARKGLSEKLMSACQTRKEVYAERRAAFAEIVGANGTEEKSFIQFCRSLFPAGYNR